MFLEEVMEKKFLSAIILSAGKSTRMGYNKMMLSVGGKTVFERTVEAFEKSESVDEIIIAAPLEDVEMYSELVKKNGYAKVKKVVTGGSSRQKSVANALKAISENAEYIAVHDGARPLIEDRAIAEVFEAAVTYGGAVVGVMSVDTLKAVDADGMIVSTIDRETTVQVRTPQVFRRDILLEAHKKALDDGFEGTDECMLVERDGHKIKTVITGKDNIKITHPEDVDYMCAVLRKRGETV